MFNFYVSASIGDAELGALPLFSKLSPEINEVKLKSRPFNSYKECVDAGQKLVTDISEQLNAVKPQYFVQSSLNPDFSKDEESSEVGIPGIGVLGEWRENELCRFYLMNRSCKDDAGIFLTKLIISVLSQQPTTTQRN